MHYNTKFMFFMIFQFISFKFLELSRMWNNMNVYSQHSCTNNRENITVQTERGGLMLPDRCAPVGLPRMFMDDLGLHHQLISFLGILERTRGTLRPGNAVPLCSVPATVFSQSSVQESCEDKKISFYFITTVAHT